MFDIGRVCVKVAGRDAGNYCVIVKMLDESFVVIEGNVRRRKCNVKHLHPQKQKLDIKEDASYNDVTAAFKKAGLPVKEKRGFKARAGKKEEAKEKKPEQKKTTKPAAKKPKEEQKPAATRKKQSAKPKSKKNSK